ncbi:MAG: protease inhibitor I42 family protein [Gammaproteobacteria bacterium]|nr:protease inhibitor I42 family protein [Gammaproteobacteria bacterium]
MRKLSYFPLILSALLLGSHNIALATDTATEPKELPKELKETTDQSVLYVGPSNPEFKVNLKTNASTGYQWLLHSYNSTLLAPIKVTNLKNPNVNIGARLTGAPTMQSWEFKIDEQAFAVPTLTEITFVYARPWEMNSNLSSNDDMTVKIIIDPNYTPSSQSKTNN